ncbi:MAG: metallophosphoesterase [Lachnospiraceae bacterium]|nr:metallophosphoesterase [Lachnospiraceae bacterium]
MMWKALAVGTAAAGAGLLLRSAYEKGHFLVEELTIVSPKIQENHTFVFLTDLHDNEFGPRNRKLLEAIQAEKPEGILIGGDMMVTKTKQGMGNLEITGTLLKGLTAIAPVYYAPGNHETRLEVEKETYGSKYRQLLEMAKALGVVMLVNKNVLLDRDLAVAGIRLSPVFYQKLLWKKPVPMPESYLNCRLGDAAEERFQLLLMHSPLYFHACRHWGADLTLAGHFHGGTIRIPGLGGVMTPQYQFFLPWCAGSFEQEGKWMAVGRGLGTHSINIRLNDMPQLLVVHLNAGAAAS